MFIKTQVVGCKNESNVFSPGLFETITEYMSQERYNTLVVFLNMETKTSRFRDEFWMAVLTKALKTYWTTLRFMSDWTSRKKTKMIQTKRTRKTEKSTAIDVPTVVTSARHCNPYCTNRSNFKLKLKRLLIEIYMFKYRRYHGYYLFNVS